MIHADGLPVVREMSPRSLVLPTSVAIVVLIVGLVFAQSQTRSAPSAAVVAGHQAPLKISNYAYTPTTLTVKVGTKITVTNADSTAHTVTAAGAFDSGTVGAGKSLSFTVTKPGVFAYICQFHAFMNGTIKVIQ